MTQDIQPATGFASPAPGWFGTVHFRAIRVIVWACWLVGGLALAVLVIALLAGVLDRFLFKIGLPWPEELGRLALIWLTFIGGIVATAQGRHFAIAFQEDPTAQPLAMRAVIALATAALSVFLAYQGWLMLDLVGGQTMAAFDISVTWMYLPFIIFACAAAVIEALMLVAIIIRLLGPAARPAVTNS